MTSPFKGAQHHLITSAAHPLNLLPCTQAGDDHTAAAHPPQPATLWGKGVGLAEGGHGHCRPQVSLAVAWKGRPGPGISQYKLIESGARIRVLQPMLFSQRVCGARGGALGSHRHPAECPCTV
eukprot:1160634-Pelagomonas_calceolata.AAC.3